MRADVTVLGRFALALALGATGGWTFAWAQMPLPWMLGAMTATTIAALFRAPLGAPMRIRPPMVAIIGVLLGAGFHPGLGAQLGGWIPTIAGLLALSVISGAACWAYLHFVAGLDRTTAYFAGMPGGLIEMVELGRQRGADESVIALSHAARIFLVVFSVPFLIQITQGISIGARPAVGVHVWEAPLDTWAWLAGCALAGSWIGTRLNLPARFLLGPMLVSAALHVTGVTNFVPPIEVVQGAQVVLGTMLGCRFASARPAAVLRMLGLSVGTTAVMLAATVAVAWAVAQISGTPFVNLVLAYSPGGLVEMSLVALALGGDVAMIATHHLVRVLSVLLGAGPTLDLVARLSAARSRRP